MAEVWQAAAWQDGVSAQKSVVGRSPAGLFLTDSLACGNWQPLDTLARKDIFSRPARQSRIMSHMSPPRPMLDPPDLHMPPGAPRGPLPLPSPAAPLVLPSISTPAFPADHHSVLTLDPDKPFVCTHPGCLWSFARHSDLRRHSKSHADPKHHCPFYQRNPTCHRNGGAFSRLDVLKRHLKLVHFVQEKRAYEELDLGWCRHCQKVFSLVKVFVAHCKECAQTMDETQVPEAGHLPQPSTEPLPPHLPSAQLPPQLHSSQTLPPHLHSTQILPPLHSQPPHPGLLYTMAYTLKSQRDTSEPPTKRPKQGL